MTAEHLEPTIADRLSANLGFLWKELALLDAIHAAADAGFAAVEFHQPFHVPAADVAAALAERALTPVSINTGVGDASRGEMGLAAIPGREADARVLIDEAIEYAAAIGAAHVSVVAGHSGRTDEAEATYRRNLSYACERAEVASCGVLIEPLSTGAGRDYHLVDMYRAAETVAAVGSSRLTIMADTFHVMTMHDSLAPIGQQLGSVGHIQFSGWPDRGEPDRGFDAVVELGEWSRAGYRGSFGAEYTPRATSGAAKDPSASNPTNIGLGWRDAFVARWEKRTMNEEQS